MKNYILAVLLVIGVEVTSFAQYNGDSSNTFSNSKIRKNSSDENKKDTKIYGDSSNKRMKSSGSSIENSEISTYSKEIFSSSVKDKRSNYVKKKNNVDFENGNTGTSKSGKSGSKNYERPNSGDAVER